MVIFEFIKLEDCTLERFYEEALKNDENRYLAITIYLNDSILCIPVFDNKQDSLNFLLSLFETKMKDIKVEKYRCFFSGRAIDGEDSVELQSMYDIRCTTDEGEDYIKALNSKSITLMKYYQD